MNESGKSDKPVVPGKSAKIRFWDFYQRYVEQMEGRGLAKENEDCAGEREGDVDYFPRSKELCPLYSIWNMMHLMLADGSQGRDLGRVPTVNTSGSSPIGLVEPDFESAEICPKSFNGEKTINIKETAVMQIRLILPFSDKASAIAISLLLFVIGCQPKRSANFGIAFNPTRKAVGLPELNPSWILAVDDGMSVVWTSPTYSSKNGPMHAVKELALDANGGAKEEQDIYYSGNTYTTVDGPQPEKLCVIYSFALARAGGQPWSAFCPGEPDYREMDLPHAVQLLKKWNVPRN
jgi:hypothetical protein